VSESRVVKSWQVAIIGQGYVGLPLAKEFVSANVKVKAIDTNSFVVDNITQNRSHVEDITNLDIANMFSSGRYSISNDFSQVSDCNAVIICVPTPLNQAGEPDLKILVSAVSSVAPYLARDTLLVSESTSFPGTLRNVIRPIVEELNKDSKNIYLSVAPERVDPGNPIWTQKNTPRVISGINDQSKKLAEELYELIADRLVKVSTPEVAEAAKLLENSFRLVNIAFINEFSKAISELGIDANQVIEAAASKPYGFFKFAPGIGAGGHCIPVDPVYLSMKFDELGISHEILKASIEENKNTYKNVIEFIEKMENQPKSILIIGISYKKGVSDTRESPAVSLFYALKNKYEVHFFDENLHALDDVFRTRNLKGYDLVLNLVTQAEIDYQMIAQNNGLFLDCQNPPVLEGQISHLYGGSNRA
jgi:UDP-N-acetyl-D-glucosamine dehydrogenase